MSMPGGEKTEVIFRSVITDGSMIYALNSKEIKSILVMNVKTDVGQNLILKQ